ncbi:aminoglycoside 3'-phosphotransferase/choline kinase family protein [Streptomyces sp. RKAG293]|uniref:aminoglycoside phosphotransferase family protein n=1 Tax=Streptomyces sp. RKAG293 TaxID=2893403 RepID=UPI0027E5109F|nr:aminoglycoside 3'-phosphotransferase/choline kinase family protein [Streptomyces sp. RKAG293]
MLKLYPTVSAEDGRTEARVLEHVQGKLPIVTPEVHADGEYENGWRYILMTQFPGQGLAGTWPHVPDADRDRLASEVGAALAALHALDTEPMREVLGPPDWSAFLAGQRATTVARQRARKLPELWVEQIPEFLASVPLAGEPERVLLHTEIMREHLLVDPGRWTLSGLFDFEPAMLGDRAYEFVAVGLFVSRGDPRLFGRVVAAYGRTFSPRELMAHTLLHVYSNLPWYFRELPAPPEDTLDSLAETWFGSA